MGRAKNLFGERGCCHKGNVHERVDLFGHLSCFCALRQIVSWSVIDGRTRCCCDLTGLVQGDDIHACCRVENSGSLSSLQPSSQ